MSQEGPARDTFCLLGLFSVIGIVLFHNRDLKWFRGSLVRERSRDRQLVKASAVYVTSFPDLFYIRRQEEKASPDLLQQTISDFPTMGWKVSYALGQCLRR